MSRTLNAQGVHSDLGYSGACFDWHACIGDNVPLNLHFWDDDLSAASLTCEFSETQNSPAIYVLASDGISPQITITPDATAGYHATIKPTIAQMNNLKDYFFRVRLIVGGIVETIATGQVILK